MSNQHADPKDQKDPLILLHLLTTAELIALHNVLTGGPWLKQVRIVLSLRTLWDREQIRVGVGAFAFDVISGRHR